MNKKLIALAIASALAAPLTASAADSTVTIFGRVQAEYAGIQIDQATVAGAAGLPGTSNRRQKAISDNGTQSRWGLDIKEDLGNGLNAIGRVEFAIRTGTGTADTAREQWVGLSSKSWGSAKFGRVNAPFKEFAGGAVLDPFVTTSLQARGSGGAMYAPVNGFGAAAFVDHAIRYDSPTFGGGFSAAVLWAPSDAQQADPNATAANAAVPAAAAAVNGGNVGGEGGKGNYQLGLKYKFGSAGEIFGGYSVDDANNAQRSAAAVNGRTADDEKVWRIGGSWTFGNFKVAGQYDDIESALGGNGGATCAAGAAGTGGEAIAAAGTTGQITTQQCNTALNTNGDGNIWFLTGQYKMGNTTFVLQGGETKADAVGAALERKAKNITVGAIHSLSKRTSIFGGFQNVSIDGARTVSQAGGASTIGGAALAIQPDRSTWSLGVRHNF